MFADNSLGGKSLRKVRPCDLTVFEGLEIQSCLDKAYLYQTQYLMGIKLTATRACFDTVVNVEDSDGEDLVNLPS